MSRSSIATFINSLYLFVSNVDATLVGQVLKFKIKRKMVIACKIKIFLSSTYVLGFLMVPLRRLILVIINISLNKKNPRSLRPPWPCGIDTKSNDRNCLSLDTKSDIPSITPFKQNNKIKPIEFSLKSSIMSGLPQVHVALLRADHFPKLLVLCNSNAIKYREPILMPLVMVFDLDALRRCVLSVFETLVHSYTRFMEKKIKWRKLNL